MSLGLQHRRPPIESNRSVNGAAELHAFRAHARACYPHAIAPTEIDANVHAQLAELHRAGGRGGMYGQQSVLLLLHHAYADTTAPDATPITDHHGRTAC